MSISFGIWALTCSLLALGCEEAPDVAQRPAPVALDVAADGTVALPSGLIVKQHEARLEPKGAPTHLVATVRLRYVSGQLADESAFGLARIEADFTHLCENFGLGLRQTSAPAAEQIIISIASEPTDFGETAPNVVQYFDSFLVQNGTCVWEGL